MPEQTPSSDRRPVEELSYEQARDELVAIVAQLEAGQLPLEESLRLWERGEALAAHCGQWLDRAESRLTGQDAPAAAESEAASTHPETDEDA